MRDAIEKAVLHQWYGKPTWSRALLPLSGVVGWVAKRRLRRFRQDNKVPPVPLLVVGNVTVGGTGKTPLVIALVAALKQRGLNVVVISRGYGAKPPTTPFNVTASGKIEQCGDEPLMMAQRTGAPVVIDANRRRAMEFAVNQCAADVIISDDGLQHYALPRTAELVVIDGQRGLGNGYCLPAGPLRERDNRLKDVDWVVINGGGFQWPNAEHMQLNATQLVNLDSGAVRPLSWLAEQPLIHAVAGIGHPARFFDSLRSLGATIQPHSFPDHYAYSAADLSFSPDAPVVMTEKDAVKCRHLADSNHWYLAVDAVLDTAFVKRLIDQLLEAAACPTE